MKIPITQSPAWGKLQDDLGETSFYRQKPGYVYLAIKKRTPVGSYLYVPYGPVAKDQQSFDQALKSLEALAREQQAFFIRIEPQNKSFQLPANATKTKDLNPAETWVLDITPPLEDLYHGMKQSTRSRCKNYPKKGLSVAVSTDPADLKYLIDFQKSLAREKHIGVFSADYLQAELAQDFATLYLVSYDPEQDTTRDSASGADPKTTKSPENTTENTPRIVAASLFFDDPATSTRYYMQSASDPTFYNNYPVFYALIHQAIKDAKDQGIKHFDFWGIAPDGAPKSHPWAGFTVFKKSFGGTAVTYTGTHDLVLSPAKYHLYKLLRRLASLRRK